MDTLILVLSHIYIPKSYFYRQNSMWKPFSNNFSLVYRGIHLEYLSNYGCLKLTLSITKFMYGTNFKVMKSNDINKFYFEVNFILKQIFAPLYDDFKYPTLTNIQEWKINRFDLVANFICCDDYQKQSYLHIFKQLKYPYFKKHIYKTGIHDGNKSSSLNFYDKNAEICFKNKTSGSLDNINALDKNILRLEIQFKKNSVNSLVNKGYLSGNKLKDLFHNIDNLNSIFSNCLIKFGLFKEFLSDEQMDSFLLNLLKNNEISKLGYKNMKATLIKNTKTKCVCKNTLNKYIKILNKYNYSNITVEKPIKNKLDFNNFELFKSDQLKKTSDQKLLILIYLYLLNLLIKKSYNRPTKILLTNLTRPFKLVEFIDDS